MQELTANDAKMLVSEAANLQTDEVTRKDKATKRGLDIQRMRNKVEAKSTAFRKRAEKRRKAAAISKKSRKANIQRQKS